MTESQRKRAEELFRSLRDRPREQHAALVDAGCPDDPDVRREVETLLKSYVEAPDFLESPPTNVFVEPDGESSGFRFGAPGLPSDAIPGYRILKELHRGGQGVVYQAIQESTRRKVAIKVMLEGPFAGDRSRRRFEREIELVGSLRHPGIVPIFDSGAADGKFFFVMEYVRGQPLDDFVKSQKPSIDDTLRLLIRVCDAVDYAHQKGVTHRDLKPGNILVDERGDPRVVDFGLAKAGGSDLDAGQSQFVSVTGQVVGTLAYMSPEQAAGRLDHVDMRSDVYSLGVIAYELLTGEPPHDVGGQMSDALAAIQHTEPKRLRTVRRQISDDVDTIVMKALSKDRARRYPTAGSLGADMQRFLDGDPIEAKRESVVYLVKRLVRRYRVPVTIAAVFALVVCVSLVVSLAFWQRAASDRDDLRDARKREATLRASADEARAKAEALAAEQERRAYNGYIARAAAALGDNNAAIMKRMLDSCANSKLRGWEWHYLRSLVDRSRRRLDEKPVQAMALSADGRWMASAGYDGVVRLWDANALALVRTLGTPGGNVVNSLAFSPDGLRIVVGDLGAAQRSRWDGRSAIRIWDTQSDDVQEIANDENPLLSIAWSADGRWIASGGIGGTAKLWDANAGFASHVVNHIAFTNVHTICFSPDSANVLAAFDSWLGIWDIDSNREIFPVRQAQTQVVGQAAFSPDGESVVWGTSSLFRHEKMELWNAKTGELRQRFSGHRGTTSSATFSPDGNRIVSAGTDNTLRLWDAKNGELLGIFRGHDGDVKIAAFRSPAGKRIFSAGDDGIRVWDSTPQPDVVTLDGHESEVAAIAFSPDGKRLVSASNDTTVRLWDTVSARQIKSWRHDGVVLDVDFSADGEHLASVSYKNKSENERGIKRATLWRLNLDWPKEAAPESNGFFDSISIPQQPTHIESVAFGDSGAKLATHQFRTIQIWDVSSRKPIATCRIDYHTEITNVAFSSDGAYLAVCGLIQPGVALVDAKTNPPTMLRTLIDRPDVLPTCVVFDAPGRRIAAGTLDGTVYVVDVNAGDYVALIGHVGPVTAVAFNPQGDRLFTGGQDQTVKVWNARTGEELLTLRGHKSRVTAVAVSPDGKTVATAGDDNTIRLWRSGP